jgi:MFS family permease
MNASPNRIAVPRAATPARQFAVTGLIGTGHFVSHFYVMALAPLLPVLAADLKVGYAELGLITTGFFAAAAAVQMPVGLLVDRIGARRMLFVGMAVVSGAITLAGLSDTYWALLGLFVLAGMGNSVFHPCDYVILSASIQESRLGRAFSFHSFCGTVGFAAAPFVMAGLSSLFGWRSALFMVGLVGLAVAVLFLLMQGVLSDDAERRKKEPGQLARTWKVLMSRKIISHFIYFVTSSAATGALGAFSVVVLVAHYGVARELAGAVLTAYLSAAAVGVIIGGILADRTKRHDRVLVLCMGGAAVVTAAAATGALSFWVCAGALTLAGLAKGVVMPSRDLMVRQDAPPGLLGAVVAFVTIGFTVGNGASPVVSGWLVDLGSPLAVFWMSSALTLVAISCVFVSRRNGATERASNS